MISIKNLSVSYKKEENILNELQLELVENKIHGIVGLNGSGKTTLLNTIFGLQKYSNGEIIFNSKKLTKKQIAFLPTENYFYSYITGREYLKIFKNKEFDDDQWNKLFELPLDSIIDSYSTGMKKKLALFSLLKIDKPILILDEPFNGLDVESSRFLRAILIKLKEKGKTIIVTSHILETLTNMCDYIHYLDNKKIKISVSKKEFDKFENEIFDIIENKNKDLINNLLNHTN